MNGLKRKIVVAVAVCGLSPLAIAQQEQQQQRPTGDRPQQQLEQAKRQQKEEMRAQGDRKVEVREMALWSLGALPPELMHKAMEKLASDPDEAKRLVMHAANIFELQASLAMQKPDIGRGQQQQKEQQQGQGQQQQKGGDEQKQQERQGGESAKRDREVNSTYQASGGGDWSHTRDQNLWRAAEDLRELAFRIEYKQVLNKEELRQTFARASVAMANFYQRAAEGGLGKADEEQTGYTLKGAAEYLVAAHAYGARKPTAEASRAIFDAERLAKQVIERSKPTTYQAHYEGGGAPGDAAQTAAARQEGTSAHGREAQQLPPESEQVVRNLGQVIRQLGPEFGGAGQQDRSREGVQQSTTPSNSNQEK